MRNTQPAFLAETKGTTRGDVIDIDAWRGPEFRAGGDQMRPATAEFSWDTKRQVQGDARFMFGDPTGKLSPVDPRDTLAAFGSELRPRWVSGTSGIQFPLGVWAIDDSYGIAKWKPIDQVLERVIGYGRMPYGTGPYGSAIREVTDVVTRWMVQGGMVEVRAYELTDAIKDDILFQERPVEPTRLGEVRRLLEPLSIALKVHPDVVDQPVPTGLVYDKPDRLDTIEDHLEALGTVHRMSEDGSFEVVPRRGVDTDVVLAPGDAEALIDLTLRMQSAKVPNHVVAHGSTDDNVPLIGHAYITSGPLAWNGPYKRRTIEYRSTANTQEGVEADAQRVLDEQGVITDVPLSCMTNAAIQPWDRVKVVFPTKAGLQSFVAPATAMDWAIVDGVPLKEMGMTVAASTSDLLRIGRKVTSARRFS